MIFIMGHVSVVSKIFSFAIMYNIVVESRSFQGKWLIVLFLKL